MNLKHIEELELKGKKVLVRFDFNVPLSKEDGKTITDTTRIDEALPTINYILEKGASHLVMMSHLGRPEGKPNPKYSLEPVATYLAEKLNQDVVLTDSAVDAGVEQLLNLKENRVVLLENLRFHPEEEKNDHDFATKLAQYADYYINDAFGVSHRKHASVYEINTFFKGKNAAGLLLKAEIKALAKIVERADKPFIGIIGGAKISDKIKTIERLLVAVDALLIGGAMAYPFLKAKGVEVGLSLCSDEDVKLAEKILTMDRGNKIVLPIDHVVATAPTATSTETTSNSTIPKNMMGLDIGHQTLQLYAQKMKGAKTVFWNGPMGFFEKPLFAKGTFEMAALISSTDAFTVVGGGDSVSAVNKSGLAKKFSHVSTGGGASLEYIEKGDLPGIQALKYGVL